MTAGRHPARAFRKPLALLGVVALLAVVAVGPASASPGTTERVSVDSVGNETGGGVAPAISTDGRFVAFDSGAGNLVAGDTNGALDVFVHDRQTGVTERVSVPNLTDQGVLGTQGNHNSRRAAISGDGRFVAFDSSGSNLVVGDTNGDQDVFVHDRQTGATVRVSVDTAGNQANSTSLLPAVSGDGRFVAFHSFATNLVAGDTNFAVDIFVRDRDTDADGIFDEPGAVAISRVSLPGLPALGNEANGWSEGAAISADGRFVAFDSMANNLVVGDTNAARDVFVHDRQTGATERVSVDSAGNQGNHFSFSPAISDDGRFVTFGSLSSNLVSGDTNTCGPFTTPLGICPDIFVHDRQTGATERVSVDSVGSQGNGRVCSSPLANPKRCASISGDGRFVAFDALADNLVTEDTNGVDDVFVHDRQTGVTEMVSVDSAGNQGNGSSFLPTLSGDGRFVAFYSVASNLVPGDTNFVNDVFVHDRSPDSDGDGVPDPSDACPDTASGATVDVNGCSQSQVDQDLDGVCDPGKASTLCTGSDNCSAVANPGQENNDGDALGDACDADDDNDGVADAADNCVFAANGGQENNDGDALGDACDPDDDNDGVPDVGDNCMLVANPGQENNDGDALGDACDPDDDNDGVLDLGDNCVLVANPGQENNDGDAPGDACDPDDDNDGVLDVNDACVFTPGLAGRQGCPVGDANLVELHVVDQAKSGACPAGAGSCKSPIQGAAVKVFDRNNAAFQTAYGTKNPSGTIYDQVFENDIGRVGACTTDALGKCTAGEETTGDYLVIVKVVTDVPGTCPDSGGFKCVYTGKPKSPGDFDVTGLASKDFQVIKVLKKSGDVQISGGSKTVVTGSYLEVVYPDQAIWEDAAAGYVYPFIFTSDSDWTVDVCAYVPTGYAIVGVYDEYGNLLTGSSCTQTFVSGETKVVAFDVIEVGSPEPVLGVLLTVEHEGKVTEVDIAVPGERTYVEEASAEPAEPAELPATGGGDGGGGGTPVWPAVAALSGVSVMLLGGLVIWRRRRA